MKILYAIQGTGNGHVSRAYEVVPELQKYGKVDLLLSGNQCDIELPWKVKYRFHGLSFIFGKKGGIDMLQTMKNAKPIRLLQEIYSVPVRDYDLIINDFEPVVAWACKIRQVPCVSLSHQSAVLHPYAPKPNQVDRLGRFILKNYAPVSESYGFHFKPINDQISTPVIRKDVRNAIPGNDGHYTVYLPSYSDEVIIKRLSAFPNVKWEVFSKHNKEALKHHNISIQPVNKEKFAKSMLNAKGVLCNAGFETPAETLFLKKKLCVIPMKGQYEQQCNAALLKEMGVPVLSSLSQQESIAQWLSKDDIVEVNYPNNLSAVIDRIFESQQANVESIPALSIGRIYF